MNNKILKITIVFIVGIFFIALYLFNIYLSNKKLDEELNLEIINKMGGVNSEYINTIKLFKNNILTIGGSNYLFLVSNNGINFYLSLVKNNVTNNEKTPN